MSAALHPLIGRTVQYTRQERQKRKTVSVTRTGVVESVTALAGREVATVKVANLLNGGMAISELVNTSELTVCAA